MTFLCHQCCASRRLLQVPHRLPLLPAVIGSLPLPLLVVPHQLDGLLTALSRGKLLAVGTMCGMHGSRARRLTDGAAANGAVWLLGDPRKARACGVFVHLLWPPSHVAEAFQAA